MKVFEVFIQVRDFIGCAPASVEFFRDCLPPEGYDRVRVVVVDVDSAYVPMKNWLDGLDGVDGVDVIRYPDNEQGNRTVFRCLGGRPFPLAITDGDLDFSGCSRTLLWDCVHALNEYPEICKAGTSLRIDDLGDVPHAESVIRQEIKYWKKKIDPHWFKADIDTTFAVWRGIDCTYGPALRSVDHVARHVPWYFGEPDEWPLDYRFYIERVRVRDTTWTSRDATRLEKADV